MDLLSSWRTVFSQGSEPSWTKEVRAWVKILAERCRKSFSHPLTGQAIPLMFVVRFFEACFMILKICYEEHKSFITPLIPWEYSWDAYFPKPEDPDAPEIDESDRTWACMKALILRWWCMPESTQSWHVRRKPKWCSTNGWALTTSNDTPKSNSGSHIAMRKVPWPGLTMLLAAALWLSPWMPSPHSGITTAVVSDPISHWGRCVSRRTLWCLHQRI